MPVPLGRHADDARGDVEVRRQPGNDPQLLIVLLAKQGDVGLHLIEQFGDHDRDAAKEVRAVVGLQPEGRAVHGNAGGEAGRVHG